MLYKWAVDGERLRPGFRYKETFRTIFGDALGTSEDVSEKASLEEAAPEEVIPDMGYVPIFEGPKDDVNEGGPK